MPNIVIYRFLDYFSQTRCEVKAEVLASGEKTSRIKLLGYGPKNAVPGTEMRVHNKSININKSQNYEWKKYTYFD